MPDRKPWRYYIDDKEVTEEEYRAAFPDKPLAENGQCSLRGWTKPLLSDALAVHPDQIPDVMERNRRAGLHVEYNAEDGRPILRSREQRRKLMKLDKCHDRDGGYGDDHHVSQVDAAGPPEEPFHPDI